MSNITDPSFRWTGSLSTNIRERFKAEGFTPPEQRATDAEIAARHEGALRCMRVMQSQAKVTHINARKYR